MQNSNPLNSDYSVEVSKMLKDLYQIFLAKFKDTRNSWDRLLEFIAIDNSAEFFFKIDHNIWWLFNDKRFRDSVFSVYDSNLLKSTYFDHLGELYFEVIIKEKITSSSLKKIQSQIKTQNFEKNKTIKILDLSLGTGRALMAIHKIYPNSIYFGVSKDLNLLRIALTNSLLFGIKCYLLYSENKEYDLGLTNEKGSKIWKESNQWKPNINNLWQNPRTFCP